MACILSVNFDCFCCLKWYFSPDFGGASRGACHDACNSIIMAYFMARLVRNLGEKVVFLGYWSQWESYRIGSGAFGVWELLF